MQTQNNLPLVGEGILYFCFEPKDTIFWQRPHQRRRGIPKIDDIPDGIDGISIVTRRLKPDGTIDVEEHTPFIPIGEISTYDELKASQPDAKLDDTVELFICTISGHIYPLKGEHCEGKDYFVR